VYGQLAEFEEKEFELWLRYWFGKRRLESYPRRRRLEALRGGRPVAVFASDLPTPAVQFGSPSNPSMVTVYPDDSVTPSDEDGAQVWPEENDL
jgi:hypothetical protein